MDRLFLFISAGMMALQLGCANSGAEDVRPELAALKEELAALKKSVQPLEKALGLSDLMAHKIQILETELKVVKDNIKVRGFERSMSTHREGHKWLTANSLVIQNSDGDQIVTLGQDRDGNGVFKIYNKAGTQLIYAGASQGDGVITVKNKAGKKVIYAGASQGGDGVIQVYNKAGKDMIHAGVSKGDTGGVMEMFNKTGELVIQLYTDDYGNGVVGAYNRKGKGRTLESK